MKKIVVAASCLVILAGALAVRYKNSSAAPDSSARRVLYYVDPMHPTYRSDKPGTAPDCGMDLEPVYESSTSSPREVQAAAVSINSAKQRLIGVQVETVEPSSGSRRIRTTGRVAVDENHLYRVLAAADGWVRSLGENATGTAVKKEEVLATFYSKDFLREQQTYFFALKTLDRVKASGHDSDEQIRQAEEQVRTSEEALRSTGMGDPQIRQLAKTRVATRDIAIASPTAGVVLARNITQSQRLEPGAELYRIADLSKVWILADVFPSDGAVPVPGTKVHVTVRELGKTLDARVSSGQPLFDAASRTLKVRLAANNPGFLLRPDMLVDIEFSVESARGISVPSDAILDSGQQKIVYVETSEGVFQPRAVEVGDATEGRTLVAGGLQQGERVVVAGNFMIDSESRMRKPPSTHEHAHD